ncbi:fungal-specific transcription factor domain-containing protein [Stachybotrys elegans]|uniref:Fungal-specific transcription factor domain-containing protein n=1 Tax=Stachybotrys elegans TaxID=80388 RepID=A0A8K0WP96_9HYPO|nr:fungal-specific transcription factor domain-containing protein [Stachybotrys elegans]
MEKQRQTRKACDLCYRKRIKCDGQKPLCSSCIIHQVSCTYDAASRKSRPRQRQHELSSREALMQARIGSLETQLENFSRQLQELRALPGTQAISPASPFADQTKEVGLVNRGNNVAEFKLPPWQDTLPVVGKYLGTLNSFLPLFQPKNLIQLVDGWYRTPELRDSTSWAVINTVLALAHAFDTSQNPEARENAALHISRVQSALTGLISQPPELATVQVLLGTAMVFQANNEHTPAAILVSTALHFAHMLRLHVRDSFDDRDPALALQRDRVFWIAYILDRSLSIRLTQAPIQRDDDIGLDLPPAEPDNDPGGLVIDGDGVTKVNYLRLRVQLAKIQSRIYDNLYSVQGQRASPQHRALALDGIVNLLDDWKSQIPEKFRCLAVAEKHHVSYSGYFATLYSDALMCRLLVGKASSWDSEWLSRLECYNKDFWHESITRGTENRLPRGWATILDESRQLMTLFSAIMNTDSSFVRLSKCSYFSALVCLTVQKLFRPYDKIRESDHELIASGMLYLDHVADQTGMEMLRRIWNACNNVNSRLQEGIW